MAALFESFTGAAAALNDPHLEGEEFVLCRPKPTELDTDPHRFTWGGPAATKTPFYDFFVSFVSSCCSLKGQHEDTMTQRLTKNPFQDC